MFPLVLHRENENEPADSLQDQLVREAQTVCAAWLDQSRGAEVMLPRFSSKQHPHQEIMSVPLLGVNISRHAHC